MGNATHADWLQDRQKGIGGSEIAAVLGLDPYCTPYQVWERKAGRVPPFEGNDATRRGQLLEPAVVQWFEAAAGLRTQELPPNTVLRHPDYPFLLGTPDRLVHPLSDAPHPDFPGVLECKTTRKMIDRTTVPMGWYFQLTWYLGITGRTKGFLAWLNGALEFDYLAVEFDAALFNDIAERAVAFWNDHVLADVPPAPVNSDDIARMYERIEEAAVEADVTTVEVWEELVKTRTKRKSLEAKETELEEALKLAMLDKTRLEYGGRTLATWKEQTRKSYTVAESTTRVFRLKE